MTKEQVKEMMKSIGQDILYEGALFIEFENPAYGEPITFKFDEKGKLIKISS